MGGSQLKSLKATLKAKGLTGQTNVKKNGKNKKGPIESRRDTRQQIIQKIRDDFNPFEKKVTKNKYDIQEKKGKTQVARPGVSKQIGEDERKAAYEFQKSRKNKVGSLIDRRFGENNPALSMEEKMLERFTRERQKTSSKRSLFNLGDDDEDDEDDENGGFKLTHSGQSLGDSFQDSDLGLKDDSGKRLYHNEGEEVEEEEQPKRKKTKAEVMKEVIAKSKFYKHERQKKQAELENQVEELNEGFDDVMSELRSAAKQNSKNTNKFSGKSEQDKEYGQQFRKLTLERRAVPTERTKTDEEVQKEKTDNQKKLEAARAARMEGMDREEVIGDDLDDDQFWVQNSDDEEKEGKEVEDEDNAELENDNDDDDEQEEVSNTKKSYKNKSISSLVKCPETHEELLAIIDEPSKSADTVRMILGKYKANLAQGNKEKLAQFTKVVIEHILYLSDSDFAKKDYEKYVETQEQLIKIVKKLSPKFFVAITEACREHLTDIEARFAAHLENDNVDFLKVSDMMFYTLVGILFSTSDHYHLVVTPAIITACMTINQMKLDSAKKMFYGLFISNLMVRYQRIAKRYIPEVSAFLEQAMCVFAREIDVSVLTVPEIEFKLSLKDDITESDIKLAQEMSISQLNDDNIDANLMLVKTIQVIDENLDIWKGKTAFIEIIKPFNMLLSKLPIESDCALGTKAKNLTDRINNAKKFADHKPLLLQSHKPIAIATYAPKFEENYNPEKKSYDPDAGRQEISKLKAQIKKEKKITIKELRKDNKFVAREKIKETKTKYEEYHRKMVSIVNSINTIEGSERNQYEKERRIRKSKK
ncbi:snoRNA-binding rRNA-processing protein [Saccharomycopsis crataegensis]|uniref:SnoRNA-binding rRNA-processing protein n=1 Tax=Saccharomycopsis crataegensis TaxID=43959 RepID=A0AAV5QIY3_9ASCO|nr:snoRNA-binding rRNA-processing protein [Saccharomycopsis crataegensis]